MNATVEYWEAQRDAIEKVVDNPLGSLVSAIVTGIYSSTSLRAVDEYSSRECGRSLFGTDREPTDSAVSNPQWSCGNVASTSRPDILSSGLPYSQLTADLAAMGAARHPRLQKSAGAILQEVAALTPEPTTAKEAFGRVSFTGYDLQAGLIDLVLAIQDACGLTPDTDFRSKIGTFMDRLTPRIEGEGIAVGSAYDTCGKSVSIGAPDPKTLLYNCGDGSVALVSMEDGSVSRRSGFPIDDPDAHNPLQSSLYLVGRNIGWLEIKTTPATGLELPTWSATFHMRDLAGGVVADLAIVEKASGEPPEKAAFFPDNNAGRSYRSNLILTLPTEVISIDGAGKVTWRLPHADLALRYQPTPSTVLLERRKFPNVSGVLVDVSTGRTLFDGDITMEFKTDVCQRNSAVSSYSGTGFWIEDVGGTVTVSNIAAATQASAWQGVTHVGVLKGSITASEPSGNVLWSISPEVVRSWTSMGSWVVVTNQSGAEVLVDARTGRESSPAPAIREILSRDKTPVLLSADLASDVASLESEGVVYQVSYKEFCG